jgi:predicted metal-dependent enzyme (double-stranded beta helix superfamily)
MAHALHLPSVMTAAPDEPTKIPVPAALKRFIWDIQSMVELADGEREILLIGRDLMARLVASDDWLPQAYAAAPAGEARQYQLYSDGMERFAVVASILPVGAALAIEAPGVWEILGALRGTLTRNAAATRELTRGSVEAFRSAAEADLRLAGAGGETVVAIHAYGGEIGRLVRRPVAASGAVGEPMGFANSEDAPPYDIFTIQTEIRD